MPRKKRQDWDSPIQEAGEDARMRSIRDALRFAGLTLALVVTVFGVAWTLWQGEQFLTGDERFRLPHEEDDETAVVIRGSHNANAAALYRVFERDRGQSLYQMDPQARRMQLRTVEWVRDASVRRIWPNRVAVDIVERQPVAFIQTPSGASGSFENPVSYHPMLVDEDGVILPVRGDVPAQLPLLTGISPDEDVEVRRTRVQKMLRLMREAPEYRAQMPEVDVTRTDNLRAVFQIDGRQVVLQLGGERFKQRIELFLRNWEKARETVQPGDMLDMTWDDRIVIKRTGSGIR